MTMVDGVDLEAAVEDYFVQNRLHVTLAKSSSFPNGIKCHSLVKWANKKASTSLKKDTINAQIK